MCCDFIHISYMYIMSNNLYNGACPLTHNSLMVHHYVFHLARTKVITRRLQYGKLVFSNMVLHKCHCMTSHPSIFWTQCEIQERHFKHVFCWSSWGSSLQKLCFSQSYRPPFFNRRMPLLERMHDISPNYEIQKTLLFNALASRSRLRRYFSPQLNVFTMIEDKWHFKPNLSLPSSQIQWYL